MVPQMADLPQRSLKKERWYYGGDDLTGALHILRVPAVLWLISCCIKTRTVWHSGTGIPRLSCNVWLSATRCLKNRLCKQPTVLQVQGASNRIQSVYDLQPTWYNSTRLHCCPDTSCNITIHIYTSSVTAISHGKRLPTSAFLRATSFL